jgi:tetratricopeptide (TPR) repeat protein
VNLLIIPPRRAAVIGLAAFIALPATLCAQATTPATTSAPTQQELARYSPAGNYLAARHASVERDAVSASAYFRAALRADPKNPVLLDRTFLSVLVDGEIDEAAKLAERLVQVDKTQRLARLVLGVRALKAKQYPAARTHIAQSVRGPIADLTATLISAWAQQGANETKAAVEGIDRLAGPEWYALFKDLHAGLLLDVAGKKQEAGKRLEKVHKLDPNQLRSVEAYGRWASRHLGKDEALKIYEAFDKVLPQHPMIVEAMNEIKSGEKLPPLIDSPQTGAAEVLFGLGATLGRQGGEDLALAYLQLAIYLAPRHPLALMSLADLYEQVKKPALALRLYQRVPAESPLKRNADIQLATNLDALDRTEEAKKILGRLIAERPDEIDAITALGNIMRVRKEFTECADVYGKAIATLKDPKRSNWMLFYFRGICNERSKQWANAEADFKRALELSPDQAHVLNYLGYSWIDQGNNLEEGMRMIRRAVEQRPDDGYIVDSLGWAHYRIQEFDEAVKHLERAVELKPEDPTINDHLGDAYWKVGRTLEAQFQWAHARDLKPEPDDLRKILEKIRTGLTDEAVPAETAKAPPPKKPGDGG